MALPGGEASVVLERVQVDIVASGDSAATAGITLSQANEMHQGALELFFPQSFRDCDVTQWSNYLARAGLPQAPEYFIRASGAASLGVTPDVGGALEAEMMVEHVAAMLGDLRSQNALPPRLGPECSLPASWQDASRNARALISGYTTFFRARKSCAAADGGSDLARERNIEKPREKPPADSFEAIEAASRAAGCPS